MMDKDLNLMIAGAAGQGMQTTGVVLGKFFVRSGCEVFALQDNMSRIRGGHNFFQIRVSHNPVKAASTPLHILIALNKESVEYHENEVIPGGAIIFDSDENHFEGENGKFLGLPLSRLALESGGDKLFSNSVAMGAVMAVLGWDIGILKDFLIEFFSARPDLARGNAVAAEAGYENALKNMCAYKGPKLSSRDTAKKMFISGHEAVALGALAAGCRFMSAYPMSPSTSIMTFLAGHAENFGIVVEQAEDEIAAVNMAIGASYAGIRSLTATSGGGFSLMAEAFGLAGITETPLVIIEAQRPGPATGLATRTEQADLLFVLHASQDEFPRAIFAPGSAGEAFYQTIQAFDLAEKYQIPVVILTDQYLADSYFTEPRFEIGDIKINRYLITEEEAEAISKYQRYKLTDSGISPRTVPGAYEFLVAADSHEHDEDGHMTEDPILREKMMEKRFKKMEGLALELNHPEPVGDPDADQILLGWGSTQGPLAEAIEILNHDGVSVKGLSLSELWPFPKQFMAEILTGVRKWGVVENNYTGQLARLIRMELLKEPDVMITKYNGRPFTPDEIVREFKSAVR